MRWLLRWYWRLRVYTNAQFILDPAAPEWFIDEELRRVGLDPNAIGRRGKLLVEKIMNEKKGRRR